MPGEVETLVQALLEQTGGGEMVPPKQTMDTARASRNPRFRGRLMERFILTHMAGNRNAAYVFGRFLNAENDLKDPTEPNEALTIDWGATAEQRKRLPISLDAIARMATLLGLCLQVKGYSDFDSVRQGVRLQEWPDAPAMLEIIGVHDLGVFWREADGRATKKSLTLTALQLLGRIAYTKRGNELFNAKNTVRFGALMSQTLDEAFADALGIKELGYYDETDPNAEAVRNAAQSRVLGAETTTLNGVAVQSYGQLKDYLMSLFYADEAFVNVFMDQITYAQHIVGGASQEHARAEFGTLYFNYYNKINAQIAPECNLTVIFPGIFSQYRKGLWWNLYDGGWAGAQTITGREGNQTDEQKLLSKHIERVFFYRPRAGQADLIEARMLQDWVGGKAVTPDRVRQEVGKVPVIDNLILRPPEQWEVENERLLAQDEASWAGKDLRPWAQRKGIVLNETHGPKALREYIQKLAALGVAAMEMDQWDSRLIGNILRYGAKVALSAQTLIEISGELAGAGGQLSESERKGMNRHSQIEAVNHKLEHGVEQAVKKLAEVKVNFLAFADMMPASSFFKSWAMGVARANMVPFLDDETTLMIDIDWKKFEESGGVYKMAKEIKRDELLGRIGVARAGELDEFVKQSGFRWSIDGSGRAFLVGSSGRPLYWTATAKEQYDAAGQALTRMYNSGHEHELAEHLLTRWKAIKDKGHNRFSINWLMGFTPMGVGALATLPASLFESLENADLIEEPDKHELIRFVESLAGPGGGVSWADGWANIGKRFGMIKRASPLGAAVDVYLPLMPPESLTPQQYGRHVDRLGMQGH